MGIEDDMLKEVQNELKWDIKRNPKGEFVGYHANLRNARNMFLTDPNLHDSVRFNEFSGDIDLTHSFEWTKGVMTPKLFDDMDLINMRNYMAHDKIQFSKDTLLDAVCSYSMENRYNPVMDYMRSLDWDGTKRVGNWLHTYCEAEDNEYVRKIGELTLVAACARVDKPGVKYDYMLILEGEQDVGKSQLCNILGGQWYGEISLHKIDKDVIAKFQGKWIVEIPELVKFSRQDVESLKAFVSTQVDRERLSYARLHKNMPRKCVFIGTFNPDGTPYLMDQTGNRRFHPVYVKNIDLSALQRDRDQLWAEAWCLYNCGYDLYLRENNLIKTAKEEQLKRSYYDEMTDDVDDYVNKIVLPGVRGMDIWKEVFKGSANNFDNKAQRRIGKIMKILGWERKLFRIGDKVNKGYTKNGNIIKNIEGIKWDE